MSLYTKAARIGIYGGTFNPVHIAHLVLAEEIRERMRLDRILFVPSGVPPHKGDRMPSGRQRLEMVRLAAAGNRFFSVRDLEVKREGISYTIETLRTLRRRYGGQTSFFFLIGMDAFQEITTWREADNLTEYTHFVVFPRPGHPLTSLVPSLPPSWRIAEAGKGRAGVRKYPIPGKKALYTVEMSTFPVSASSIRERAARGRSLRYLVPEAVERYIRRRNLYATRSKGG